MNYKLVVLDVDDTLLNSRSELPDAVRGAVLRAQEKVIVTVATGRGYLGSKRFIDAIGVNSMVINYGGAQITDAATSEIKSIASVPMPLLREAVEMARSYPMHIQVYDGDDFIYDEDNEWAELYASFLGYKGRAVGDVLEYEWCSPKLLCIDDPELIKKRLPEFSERFKGRLRVSASKPPYIELNDINSDKGVAIKKLGELLGVKREEIIAVGDNSIDKPMIEYAGLGVCMANGTDEVKAVADYIAPGNDENGVAHVLEKFIFGA